MKKILIALVAFVVVGLAWTSLYKEEVVPVPVATSSVTELPSLENVTWERYESKELGISFEYPKEYLTQEFHISPGGDSGRFFYGQVLFPSKTRLLVVSLSPDYTAGRDGNWSDSLGFKENLNKSFTLRYPLEKTRNIASGRLFSVAGDQLSAVSFAKEDFGPEGEDSYFPDRLSIVNLKNKSFPAFNVELHAWAPAHLDSREVVVVERIVGSIALLKN